MKKLFFLLTFVFTLGMSAVQAQSCQGAASAAGTTKSCCASKMAKAAASDPTIESRIADNGTVSYMRKETDQQGQVRFVSVQFDEASSAFVNVAPKSISEDEKAAMTKKSASCASEANGAKKACCAGEAGKKNCSASEKKACAGEKM